MVDKMMKYSFILLSEETEGFLAKLQELGVVDVTRSAKPIDEHSASVMDTVISAKKVIGKLESLNFTKDAGQNEIQKAKASAVLDADLTAGAQQALVELMELELAKSAAEKEVALRKPWGDFDKSRLDQLNTLGYVVRYYKVSAKKFNHAWAELQPLEIINQDSSFVWFVTVASSSEEYNFPVETTPAPEGSWNEAQAVVDSLTEQIYDVKGLLLKYQEAIPQMNETNRLELVNLDMYLAKAATESAADNLLSVIEGFAPVENEATLCNEFDQMGVLYIKEEAAAVDNPPIKLKNNKFVKMFESITAMYGMPNYEEYDPTPVISIFFLLFFAMCMGDAGYGLALIIIGLAIKKNWVKISMFDGLGGLIATLGVATTVVGFFLGTAFGVALNEVSWMPEEAKKCMLTGDLWGYPIQMVLAIGIGVFHLCLAMVIKAVGYTQRLGFKENISTWGWLILILGGIIIGALALLGVIDDKITKIAVIAIGVISALGIFIFNTPGRNPLINIGAGLWDTYNMVTGIMGDVLSYIRLYALGLAGGMLGAAFNDLGLMVRGDGGVTGWIFFVVILLLGHVINLLMSCLGAFVHPLRLNFVEYFKNAGYEGKGKTYNPLKK